MTDRIKVLEAIVVEGRDDQDVVSRACDALIITTHGFGIRKETWNLIDKAYREKGIIILTDPDYSGEEIRRQITRRFPNAKQAYIPRNRATKNGDIGVENATPEDVIEALNKVHAAIAEPDPDPITQREIRSLGLADGAGSRDRREAVCNELGIGYGNAGTFLKRINAFGITREMLKEAVDRIG